MTNFCGFFAGKKTRMEKKLLLIAATFLAKLVWKFGKISSGPLRLVVFWIVQAFVMALFRIIRDNIAKRRPFKTGQEPAFSSAGGQARNSHASFSSRVRENAGRLCQIRRP